MKTNTYNMYSSENGLIKKDKEILKPGSSFINLYIQITDESVSKLKHWFHVFQKASKPTQFFGVIQICLPGKSRNTQEKQGRIKRSGKNHWCFCASELKFRQIQ